MKQQTAVDTEALTSLSRKAEEIADPFIGSLFVIMGGIIAIYLIHKIASKFLFPHFHKGRLIKVTGITLYALILLATALIVLRSIGVDVSGIGQVALVTVFVIAVLSFFLLPFLPRLPFKIGHLLEVRGELGMVTAISPLYTTLKKFDGTVVLVPNAAIMSTIINNYSHELTRRIEINLSVQNDLDTGRAKAALVGLMTKDKRVLEEPSKPAVFVVNANADYVELLAVCWVKNEDWLTTQSDLWEKVANATEEDVHLAKPYLTR